MALVETFDFTDAPGDLTGGRVELNRRYNTGRTESHTSPVPGEATVSGTSTSGQIRFTACPLYDDGTTSTETLMLFDAHGRASNSLSVNTTRPAGDP
jgi:hypothetical protein